MSPDGGISNDDRLCMLESDDSIEDVDESEQSDTDADEKCYRAAQDYARRSWPVLPIHTQDKYL